MSESVYVVVPVLAEAWITCGELSADCLNEIHSADKTILGELGLVDRKQYEHNTLQLNITRNHDQYARETDNSTAIVHVLIDAQFFKQNEYNYNIFENSIRIKQLTALKLLDIVREVRRRANMD